MMPDKQNKAYVFKILLHHNGTVSNYILPSESNSKVVKKKLQMTKERSHCERCKKNAVDLNTSSNLHSAYLTGTKRQFCCGTV